MLLGSHIQVYLLVPSRSTLTSHSGILTVARVTGHKGITWTLNEASLNTSAANIVQMNWTNPSTKVSIAEG